MREEVIKFRTQRKLRSEKSNNGVDSSGIFWMSKFTRNSYPKKVVWKQDDVTHSRFYWLKVNEPKAYS